MRLLPSVTAAREQLALIDRELTGGVKLNAQARVRLLTQRTLVCRELLRFEAVRLRAREQKHRRKQDKPSRARARKALPVPPLAVDMEKFLGTVPGVNDGGLIGAVEQKAEERDGEEVHSEGD